MIIAALIILILLAVWAFYQGLTTGHYVISSTKLEKDIRLCLITDLHSVTWGKDQSLLVRRIEATRPDIILLGGDIFDAKYADPTPPVESLLKGIQNLAPCYYVTGSHDIWTWQAAEQEKLLKAYGVITLHGETCTLTVRGQELMISGIDEPAAAVLAGVMDEKTFYLESLKVFEKLDTSRFNLLIAHRPEFIKAYAELGFDLTVSGHCHGGQVRIPLLINGLYAPGQGLLPKYAAGKYRVNQTWLIVSRGLHFTWHLPRIFNRPEIVEIMLIGEEKKEGV